MHFICLACCTLHAEQTKQTADSCLRLVCPHQHRVCLAALRQPRLNMYTGLSTIYIYIYNICVHFVQLLDSGQWDYGTDVYIIGVVSCFCVLRCEIPFSFLTCNKACEHVHCVCVVLIVFMNSDLNGKTCPSSYFQFSDMSALVHTMQSYCCCKCLFAFNTNCCVFRGFFFDLIMSFFFCFHIHGRCVLLSLYKCVYGCAV